MQTERSLRARWVEAEWRETDHPQTVFVPHCHDRYEIYCFFSGQANFQVEGVSYAMQPGGILLLERSRFHSVQASAGPGLYSRLVVHFAPELLYPEERPLLELFRRPEIFYPNAWQGGPQQAMQGLERAFALPDAVRDIAIRTKMVDFLVELFAISPTAVGPAEDGGRIRQVLAYINANLTQPMNQGDLAARFYMGRNSLTRAFKRATGTTVGSYILYKRMALARILLQAGHPAGVVARECGYADYSTFYRGYCKVFGKPPTQPLGDGTEPSPTVLAPAPEAL